VFVSAHPLKVCCAAILILILHSNPVAAVPAARVLTVNGDFERSLAGWTTDGEVVLNTSHPFEGKTSVRIGPGAGSITQHVTIDSQNHLQLSALLHSDPAGSGDLTLRFLDKDGKELMRLDSSEMKHGRDPDRIEFYVKPHPLTASIEIVISKAGARGYLEAADISLGVYDEDDPALQTTENLDEAMRPFWQGNLVSNEAVLMFARDGKPAIGTLMFTPTRIVSVIDYGSSVQYQEGSDFTVEGRTLICTPGSRITQVRDAELQKGELAWNVLGGKQVLVTYEHSDAWTGPVQGYVGTRLPNTMRKLAAREALRIVAYGDSIAFGIGSSRILKIPPFQPPWIELFAHQLAKVWDDPAIMLYNSSQSGADSQWAKAMAGRMVATLSPDLVVIAFGQNDFWRIAAGDFAANIASVMAIVRAKNPRAEFLLVSTMRFDPAYTAKQSYWDLVSQYDTELRALTAKGVQLVDFTNISGAVFAAKAPKDCLNDPLHPDDYLSRWYAQCAVAALVPSGSQDLSVASSNRDRTAPDLDLHLVRGGHFRLRDHRGKSVLLAFVQTQPDSGEGNPSRALVPQLASMDRQYREAGLEVVLIDETRLARSAVAAPRREDLLNTTYDWSLQLPLAEDPAANAALIYGVKTVPTLVLIDRNGQIRDRWVGGVHPGDLASAVQETIGARAEQGARKTR
jgi:lysophospholipase L1-like esterase